MATSQTLPPNVSRAPELLTATSILFFIALSLFIARCYTRTRPKLRLGWDDVTLSIGMVFAIFQYTMAVLATHYGVGRHIYYVSPSDIVSAFRLLFLTQIAWVWGVTLIKVSVSLMLLRITMERGWQICLWCLIAMLFICGFATTIIQLIECTPIRAYWDRTLPGAKCWSPSAVKTTLYVLSGIFILSDVACSFFPLTFIHQLQRPLREKVVIAGLMMIGLIATAAATVKMFQIGIYMKSKDLLWDAADGGMWGMIEEYLGIMAACLPCLKQPFEKGLRNMGLLTAVDGISYGSSARNSNTVAMKSSRNEYELGSNRSSWWRNRSSIGQSDEQILSTVILDKENRKDDILEKDIHVIKEVKPE